MECLFERVLSVWQCGFKGASWACIRCAWGVFLDVLVEADGHGAAVLVVEVAIGQLVGGRRHKGHAADLWQGNSVIRHLFGGKDNKQMDQTTL